MRVFLLIGCALAVSLQAHAESDIDKLIELSGCHEIIEQQRETALTQLAVFRDQIVADSSEMFASDESGALRAAFEREFEKLMVSAEPGWTTEQAISRYKELLQAHYSPPEIAQLIEFYESPLGKKMRTVTPLIQQEWMLYLTEGDAERLTAAAGEFRASFSRAVHEHRRR